MKRQFSLLAITLILLVSTANAQTANVSAAAPWKTYTVQGEDFSVDLPILPARHLSRLFDERRKKSRREIRIGSYADGVVYIVYVVENPKPRLPLESFISQQGGTWSFTGQRDLTRNGISVKGLVYSDPAWGMTQYFAEGDRLYRFGALGAPADDPRLTRFFSSLSLSKAKDAIEVVDGPGLPYELPVQQDDDISKKYFVGKEVDRKARLAMKPEPSYTEEARRNGVTGTVVLKCVFASNGSVVSIRIVSGLPYGLTEKAIDAARKIKFIPAMKDGKYVSMWMQLEYNFNLY